LKTWWVGRFIGQIRRFIQAKLLTVMPNDRRIRGLRQQGVRIGERCIVSTTNFSTEPYLVEIGNHVAISVGCQFVTHDAAIWVFRDANPDMDVFGPIKVGDNTYFGTNCTILPNSTIGSNCIIGSGTVVRGNIPDGSVVLGNPARVVMKTALIKHLLVHHKNRLDTHALLPKDKKRAIQGHFGLDDRGPRR
jgi:acetyltransferase-like isoleucine patch superfamily enzyme